MEPLPEGSGRRSGREHPAPAPASLQWSRFPKEAEGKQEMRMRFRQGSLQWSRFPKEAEGHPQEPHQGTPAAASMEPLPEGSGRESLAERRDVVRGGFNGAASRRKRKDGRPRPAAGGGGMLQWSRFPKEAEGLRWTAWRVRIDRSFNGAASRRKRKGKKRHRHIQPRPLASMEPLPEGSGRYTFDSAARRADLLQWSRFPKEAEG